MDIMCRFFFSLGLLLAGSLMLFPTHAQAACATPTASAGALEWFVADLKFKYCDGTNWNFLGAGGLWTQNGSNVYYSTGNVGIGVTNPVVAMDVNGSIRMGSSGATCNSTYEGTMRFNSATDQVQVCDGTAWPP